MVFGRWVDQILRKVALQYECPLFIFRYSIASASSSNDCEKLDRGSLPCVEPRQQFVALPTSYPATSPAVHFPMANVSQVAPWWLEESVQ